MKSGTSSSLTLFSFVKLFPPANNVKNITVTKLEKHTDCHCMSSSSEVAYGFRYTYVEEKRTMRKISIFTLHESLEFPSSTLCPATLLSVMIHGIKDLIIRNY